MNITWSLIVVSALIDSINPCAFAVLIFLIMYLLAIRDKKLMLKIGLVYISVVFTVYFLAGIGLLSFIQSVQLTKFFYYLTATISIVLGLINVKNAFFSEKPLLAIPESQKPLLFKYIKKATIGASIVLGFLVAVFELPCTGGVYLAILSLLADRNVWLEAVVYLLVYNFIFILPLLVILVGVYFGYSPEKFEKLRRSGKVTMRLVLGLLLIGLGILMFFL